MESSRDIEERAAAWLLRREKGDWSEADQTQLTEWIESSMLHRVAFLRLEAGWAEANRLKALGAGFPRGKVPSSSELTNDTVPSSGIPVRTRTPAERWFPVAVAATLLLLVIGAVLYTQD